MGTRPSGNERKWDGLFDQRKLVENACCELDEEGRVGNRRNDGSCSQRHTSDQRRKSGNGPIGVVSLTTGGV